MLFGELDKPVVIDEALRLSKKFSSPDSYKFINVSLFIFIKSIILSINLLSDLLMGQLIL